MIKAALITPGKTAIASALSSNSLGIALSRTFIISVKTFAAALAWRVASSNLVFFCAGAARAQTSTTKEMLREKEKARWIKVLINLPPIFSNYRREVIPETVANGKRESASNSRDQRSIVTRYARAPRLDLARERPRRIPVPAVALCKP